MMEQKEISQKELKAMEKVKRANAELAKVRREERKQLRKEQDHHKFMMGGVIVKYFPEAYDFSEQEMNRIIACAFSLKDVRNMIATVKKERPDPEETISNEEDENDDYEYDETEENDPDEGKVDDGGDT
ncbi:MAG: hypothetical protein J5476_02710 [Lachnospiraceae bacterium]|nr:hypothetical protein [Lachnospiraceae bacterium]